MPTVIRTCAADGFFEGQACPACGRTGQELLSGSRRRHLSKYLSGALRHFPGDAGVELDDPGHDSKT